MAGIIDRDHGWKQLMAAVRSMKNGGSYVKMGLIGENAGKTEHAEVTKEGEKPSPLTNVDLMAIHEFGTEHVPERSVIRRSFDEHQGEYEELLAGMLQGVVTGKVSVFKMLDVVGYRMEWAAKHLILDGQVTPPLAPSTIAAKIKKGEWNHGSSASNAPTPLMDTGRLAAAISHEVVAADAGEGDDGGEQVGSATIVKDES